MIVGWFWNKFGMMLKLFWQVYLDVFKQIQRHGCNTMDYGCAPWRQMQCRRYTCALGGLGEHRGGRRAAQLKVRAARAARWRRQRSYEGVMLRERAERPLLATPDCEGARVDRSSSGCEQLVMSRAPPHVAAAWG